jgi:AcrR family transcriptional regulator
MSYIIEEKGKISYFPCKNGGFEFLFLVQIIPIFFDVLQIYYHFKNKAELLKTIITMFLTEYDRILKDDSERGIDKIARYIEFLKQNKDCTRIIIAESLKQGDNQTAIFKVLETLMKNIPESGDREHWVTEFFTSILPAGLFICYEENWCNYFNTQPEILTNDFLQAYKWTHGSYHELVKRESM